MPAPEVTPFFDEATHTFSHMVADPETARCAIIDSVLDYDDAAGRTDTTAAEVLHTPGHTPACVTYVIRDAAFVGDTLFMPDFGTARCDFPGGDARTLYRSIRRIFELPDETRLFLCHDYKAPGRDHFCCETTVAEEKCHNLHVREGIEEDGFVAMRRARDERLGLPRRILPSVQTNMRGGRAPDPEDNGISYLESYLEVPLDLL